MAANTPLEREVLIEAQNVGKKFCRSLKRSLLYGAHDIAQAINPFTNSVHRKPQDDWPELRKDEFWAVRDVSFKVRRGECIGLIGHNGAGKSTLLKILNNLIKPDHGKITMRGRVSALIELNSGFNSILSGRENIRIQGSLLGLTREEIEAKIDDIIEFSEIREFIDMPVKNYSSGMRVRLGFAIAAQLQPDILIIDEVLAVGDIAFRMKCLNTIGEKMQNTAVIFVSHSMPQILRICNDLIVLNHGKIEHHNRNIPDGVAIYLALNKNTDQQITGSGKIKLDDVVISDGKNSVGMSENITVPFSSSIRIRAKIQVLQPIESFRLQFVAWDAQMLPAMDIMHDSQKGFLVRTNGLSSFEVEATIDNIELNSGKYMLSAHMTAEDLRETYCRHDNFGYVTISGNAPSAAMLVKAAKWNTIEASPEESEDRIPSH